VYGTPVVGFAAGAKIDGPKPAQTGIDGVIVCVRSTYFACRSWA
jgi:hypothetical protein